MNAASTPIDLVTYGAEVAEVRFCPYDASRLMGEPGESKRFNANMTFQAGIAPMVQQP
jgi:hypothetical protein